LSRDESRLTEDSEVCPDIGMEMRFVDGEQTGDGKMTGIVRMQEGDLEFRPEFRT
jgi:hypothetical protein